MGVRIRVITERGKLRICVARLSVEMTGRNDSGAMLGVSEGSVCAGETAGNLFGSVEIRIFDHSRAEIVLR